MPTDTAGRTGPPAPVGLRKGPIYLDYDSTTPVDPRVLDAILPYLTVSFGSAASSNHYGMAPRQALGQARKQVAQLIGAAAEAIIFTGSGSEANALAIAGVMLTYRGAGDPAEVITQPTEHPSVLETCRMLHRRNGVRVTYLPVGADGMVKAGDLAEVISPRTALVSIMIASHETGVLQPVGQLARIARQHGVPFHTDAAQAAGKIGLDVAQLGVDLLTVAGHKMYAPAGIGALYVRPGLLLEPIIAGGGQEWGLRAGTEPVALAAALGAAAELARGELTDGRPEELRQLRDGLHSRLDEYLPGLVYLNGHPGHRLPGTLNVGITGLRGTDLLAAAPGIAAFSGGACHSGSPQPSPASQSIPNDLDRAQAAMRLSLGRWTTDDEVERAAKEIAVTARALLAAAESR
jgi:cysteine desulfurase